MIPLDPPPIEQGPRASTWLFRVVVLLLFGILTAQLWRLQVVDGQAYINRSAANWLRQAVIPPQRGVIYDRNRTLLATNAPSKPAPSPTPMSEIPLLRTNRNTSARLAPSAKRIPISRVRCVVLSAITP